MRFFIVGTTEYYSLQSSLARALRQLGADVQQWNNREPYALFRKRNWWSLSRAEREAYGYYASLKYYQAVKAFKPDVLLHLKAENIHSYATRRVLEETRARLVVWYPDNPFKADMSSINVLKSIREASIFCIWGKYLMESIKSAGAARVEYLPFAFDPSLHDSASIQAREDLRSEISFVGTWDPERQRDMTPLSELPFSIWGPGWKENVPRSHPLYPCVRGSALYGDDLVAALKSTKIAFNHLRQHNGSAHNMRAMEITGIGGGAMLVRRTPELAEQLFTEGSEILCFENDQEMLEVAGNFLEKPTSLSQLARKRVLNEHTITQRAETLLEWLK